jgi:hypothetical protein
MIVSLYFCFLGSSTTLRSPLELFLQAYITWALSQVLGQQPSTDPKRLR